MTEPLQPSQPTPDAVPVPDAQKPQPSSKEGIVSTLLKVAADLRASLTSEQQSGQPVIREGDFRELRESLRNREEIKELVQSDAAIGNARGGTDAAAVEKLVEEHIKRMENVSTVFLNDAEAECVMPAIDLGKTRVLIQYGYSYAKTLATGKYKNPSGLNALKAWQSKLAEPTSEKPDLIMLTQWIYLCTGFAPELATELAGKYQEAIAKRCEYFIAKVEEELAKEKPNMSVIGMNIIVPPDYYVQLTPGSTIPERVKALEARVDALQRK